MVQNLQSTEIAVAYIDFLTELEDVYPNICDQGSLEASQNQREEMLETFFESCLENVCVSDPGSIQVWLRYADFETMRNNLVALNTICYFGLEQNLDQVSLLEQKYIGILQTLFENIYKSSDSPPIRSNKLKAKKE